MPTPADRYIQEHGAEAYQRQHAALSDRCPDCWAMPGSAHVATCPRRDDEQQLDLAPEPEQKETLF